MLVALGFAFTAIPLVFEGHIDSVFFVRKGVELVMGSLRPGEGVGAILEG